MFGKFREKCLFLLGLWLLCVPSYAQLPSGWEIQATGMRVTPSTSASNGVVTVNVQNASTSTRFINIFTGPLVSASTGTLTNLSLKANKVAGMGTPPRFGVGFHFFNSSGGYLGEKDKEHIQSLTTTPSPMAFSLTTGAGVARVRPRVSVYNIPRGASFSFRLREVQVSLGNQVSAPAPAPSPVSCTLTNSGPVTASRNGQIIEDLKITANGQYGVNVNGFSDVIIRNVLIEHRGGMGISFNNAPRIRIENVSIRYTGAPSAGPNPSSEHYNIGCFNSPDAVVRNARVEKGSSGVWMGNCQRPRLSFIEGHDFRGPFPRGQVVQFDHSHDALLEDFSSECPGNTSWTEDNVNVWRSSRATIRRGLVDGNNSPSGIGVIFEHDDGIATDGLVEDVDAVHQGNGCFSGYPGRNVTFNRTRCSDNICTSQQGRGAPLSNALAWAGEPSRSSNLKVLSSNYDRLCNRGNIIWNATVFSTVQLTRQAFAPRAPLRLRFCFQP